ncbi:DUF2147 domain-containing protein [Arcicella rosea]|uniref:Uncharacterized protein (DUF2147 family) n=1 Tax=Arcicella rosea TaxID=502909 RepID=A0A841ET67_9BACT|nr:DUF2147 domain-containing protein [Arcicella rosea]MBB6004233.1 uncharacterized protein (DUF2147 family) [Arcicella rosea]
MKNLINTLVILLLVVNVSKAQSVSKDAILGEWLSQEKDGKVLIFKQGEKYFGKISWGKSTGRKDSKNPDASLRNRDIIGSTILKDFVFKGKNWEDGTIYDPNSGKTYSCTMKLKNDDALEIRGYVGISLLGRTTLWTRVK